MHCLNGVPVVKAPLQDASTLSDVSLYLEATTDLTSGTWSLPRDGGGPIGSAREPLPLGAGLCAAAGIPPA